MNKQEHRIATKIIRDLCLLMLDSGHHDFTVNVNECSNQTIIEFNAEKINDSIIKDIEENLTCERAIEIETYGFELLGDFEAQNELKILGCLIDDVKVSKDKGETTITITRKNLYDT